MKVVGIVLTAALAIGLSFSVGPDELAARIRSAVTASGGLFSAAIVETGGPVECRGKDETLVCAARSRVIRMLASSAGVGDNAPLELHLRVEAKNVELSQQKKMLLVFTTPASWTDRVVIALEPTPENVETMRHAVEVALGRPVETKRQSTTPGEPIQRPVPPEN